MRRILASLFTLILFTGAVHALDFPAYRTNGIAFNGGTFVDTVFENVPYVGSDLVDSLFQGSSKWISLHWATIDVLGTGPDPKLVFGF